MGDQKVDMIKAMARTKIPVLQPIPVLPRNDDNNLLTPGQTSSDQSMTGESFDWKDHDAEQEPMDLNSRSSDELVAPGKRGPSEASSLTEFLYFEHMTMTDESSDWKDHDAEKEPMNSSVPKSRVHIPPLNSRSSDEVVAPGKRGPSEASSLTEFTMTDESSDQKDQDAEKELDSSNSLLEKSVIDAGGLGQGDRMEPTAEEPNGGKYYSQDQLEQIRKLAKEQEVASKIMMELAQKMTRCLEGVRGPKGNRAKWPTSQELTVIIMIGMVFVLMTCIVQFLCAPEEPRIPSRWEYLTDLGNRLLHSYKQFCISYYFKLFN